MQGVTAYPSKEKRKRHPRINRDITPLPGEVWKDIKEWKGQDIQEGYQVSNFGRVRNLGRVLTQIGRNGLPIQHPYPPCMLVLNHDEDGYLFVALRTAGDTHKSKDARVHQLVATYFLDYPPRPDQTHVNHIDGNKNNNTPANLEWASPEENNLHARTTGLARLGTSQAIQARIIEWNEIVSSKTQLNLRLGMKPGYVEYREAHNMPIIDKNSGQEVHIEWLGVRKEQ